MSEPQAWHGLSHKQAWGDLGSSYADLHERQARHAVADARTVSSDVVVKMQQPAAGVESAARPKGAGTFQLQVSFDGACKSSAMTLLAIQQLAEWMGFSTKRNWPELLHY